MKREEAILTRGLKSSEVMMNRIAKYLIRRVYLSILEIKLFNR